MKSATLATDTVWYSASNEDTRSECAALVPSGKSLLCITASGSRTFDLLIEDPARIVSIDQNPAQTAFAQLLAAAYRSFDYPAFCAFLGLSHSVDRSAQLEALLPQLPPEAAAFWRRNGQSVETGLLYCGKWEGYLRQIQWLAGSRRRALADRLLHTHSLAEQHQLWERAWNNRSWRMFLRVLSQRWLWTHVFREPGMQFVPTNVDIGGYARERFDHAARNVQLAELPFAWLLMMGCYPLDVLPPYLTEHGHSLIRERLDRVTFVTASLQETLDHSAADAFDGASLSDYSSYCDVDVQRAVWAQLRRVIAPGGRVCERKFFNKSGAHLPGELGFRRDTALEDRLFAQDQALFYSFVIAERGQGDEI